MMRFLSGFLGGATATSSILYVSVVAHMQARTAQRALLQEQVHALSALCEPDGRAPPPVPLVRDGLHRGGLVVSLKDSWNARLTGLAIATDRS